MSYRRYTNFRDPITGIMMEKLSSFPTTPKLVVTLHPIDDHASKEIPELLHVKYEGGKAVVRTILEVVCKRWQTLDLVSITKEAQRTVEKDSRTCWNRITKITDNLSAIPKFQTTSEQS